MFIGRDRCGDAAKGQDGAVSVMVIVALVALLGMAALAIDVSMLYVAKQELQNVADAGALAGVGKMRSGPDEDAVRADVVAVGQENTVLGESVILEGEDITVGLLDEDTGEWTEGWPGDALPQVKVTARRTQDSSNGPVQMSFARLFGIEQVEVTATSTAGLSCQGRPRIPVEIVTVQDCSGSFIEEIEIAKNADGALVNLVHENCMDGDKLGIVGFNTQAYTLTDAYIAPPRPPWWPSWWPWPLPWHQQSTTGGHPLCTIPEETDKVYAGIDRINNEVPVEGYTYTELGIQSATGIFGAYGAGDAAEQVIVLMSDGLPNPFEHRALTVDACDVAAEEGIVIHTVTYDEDSAEGHYGSRGSDAEFNASLVRNGGYAFHTPSAADLEMIMITVGIIEIGHPMLVQ